MGLYPMRCDLIGFLRTQDSLILFEISFFWAKSWHCIDFFIYRIIIKEC
jgi:hypothetical protein